MSKELNNLFNEIMLLADDNLLVKNYLKNTHTILIAYAIATKIPPKKLAEAISNVSAIKKYEDDLVRAIDQGDKSVEDVIKRAK